MKWTNRIENIVIMICSIILTAFFMNLFVVKPIKVINKENLDRYEKRIDKQNQLFLELAKVERLKIENTFTIKKPKKGSTVDVVIDNKMDAEFQKQAENLNTLINNFNKQDTILVKKKSFFQRLFSK